MDDRSEQTTEYRLAVEKIKTENIDELARTKELGTSLDFSPALPQLREMAQHLDSFSKSDLDRLPVQSIQILIGCCKQLLAIIESIKVFGPGESNALNARTGILNTIDQTHYHFVQVLSPFIAILRYRDNASIAGLGGTEVSERFASLDANLNKSNDQLNEIESILENTRKFAAESVVNQQASVFLIQSATHKKTASRWLVALFVLLLLTLGAAIYSYTVTPTAISSASGTSVVVYLLASKSVIFGLLIFSILVTARNYSAHRHNEVVNKHRHNALLTYNTFVAAGSSPEMRDIVLNHASTAIYGPTDTGYNKHPEAPASIFPMINLPIGKQL